MTANGKHGMTTRRFRGKGDARIGTGTGIVVLLAAFAGLHAPVSAHAQQVVWVEDARKLPAHRTRGRILAEADLRAGALKWYVPVCTFPVADPGDVRRYEIRKTLYGASGIQVKADLCNDVLPNASQQEAFVEGYNAVMGTAIAGRLGQDWREAIEKRVALELRRQPKGRLRAQDIGFETPY